ncbi:hypothetical protein [Haloparvum sp. AD34]
MSEDSSLEELIDKLFRTKTGKLKRRWWHFLPLREPALPDGVRGRVTLWPPFLGVRVEIGGDRHA